MKTVATLVLALGLGLPADSRASDFQNTLDLIEKRENSETPLLWSAATALLRASQGLDGAVLERAERLANAAQTKDATSFLIFLYQREPANRAKALGSWPDSQGLDESGGLLPSVPLSFLAATVSELRATTKTPSQSGKLASAQTSDLVRALLARDLPAEERSKVVAKVEQWKGSSFLTPAQQPQRQHQLLLTYLLFQNPQMGADRRELASRLAELLEGLGKGPVEDLLRTVVTEELNTLPEAGYGEVTLQKVVENSLPAQSSPGLPGPFPPFPGVDANEILSAIGDDRVFALPYPSASLSRAGKVITGQALEIWSGDPRVFHGGTTLVAMPPTRDANVKEIVGLLGRLSFKGSDLDMGCFYEAENHVFSLPQYPNVPILRQGLLVDAYTKRTGGAEASKPTPADFKFWIASVIKNKEAVDWYAVRWTGGAQSSPLGKEISLSTREKLMRREDINETWVGTGRVQPYSWWPAARDPDRYTDMWLKSYKKEPMYSDPSRPTYRRFAEVWDDLVAEQYSLPHAEPISCLGNCWSAEPTAVEPATGWQVYKVDPVSNFPFVLHTTAHPLVTHRSDVVYHGGGGFTSNSFDVIAINPHQAKLPLFHDIHPLDVAKSVPMGLLSYADSLSRTTLPGGWLSPIVEGSPELSALVALVRLSMLNALSSLPETGFPAEETSEAPWKQRLKLLRVSLGSLSKKVFDRYQGAVSESVRKHYKQRASTKAVLDRVLAALSSEDTLSEDRIYVLLGYAKRNLNIRDNRILEAKEELVLALKGAYERLLDHLKATETSFAMACDIIDRLQVVGSNGVVSMVSDAETLKLCGSVLERR